MNPPSPLRYPGGKSRFSRLISDAIFYSGREAHTFVEPFCGGAGAAIKLLIEQRVNQIALNDIDPLVSSFWKVVFGKTRRTRHDINWLIGEVEKAQFSVEEWRWHKSRKPESVRDAAWKCLYLNRTSFNGILYQSGPIGGWEQKNRRLDVRFNQEKIISALRNLYDMRDGVERVEGTGWGEFCSYYEKSVKAYFYFDPPYYERAEQLYGHFFDSRAHYELRDYLLNLSTPWILSYDDAPEIRALYNGLPGIDGRVIDKTYSAHPVGGASFVGRELFFSNCSLPMPVNFEGRKKHVGLSVIGNVNQVSVLSRRPYHSSQESENESLPLFDTNNI